MSLRILLVSGAGMSISFLVKYIQEPDDVLGEGVEVWAVFR